MTRTTRSPRHRQYSDDESGIWAFAALVIVIAVLAAGAYAPIVSASPRSSLIAPRSNSCPAVRGTCAGALVAGTHRSDSFQPPMVYSVPDGWINTHDVDGGFRLFRSDGSGRHPAVTTVIEIYRDPALALSPCADPPPTASATIETLAQWLRDDPALAASAPTPVTIGGLTGTTLTITSRPGDGNCERPPAAALPLFDGAGPYRSQLLAGATRTLHLLAVGAGTVIVDITVSGGLRRPPQPWRSGAGVVASLSFFPLRAPS